MKPGKRIFKLSSLTVRFISVFAAVTLIIHPVELFSQDQEFRPSRQAASEAFARNDFEEAHRHYSGLLELFPRDPLYRYLTGICLVRLQRDPSDAVEHLRLAAESSGAVKPVPADVWFWLGRAQQMAGMFPEAVISYNKYTDVAGRRASREMDVPGYLREAADRRGGLYADERKPAAVKAAEKYEAGKNKMPGTTPAGREEKSLAGQVELAPPEVDSLLDEILSGSAPAQVVPAIPLIKQPGNQVVAEADEINKGKAEAAREIIKAEAPSGAPQSNRDEAGKAVDETNGFRPAAPSLEAPVRRRAVFSRFAIIDEPVPAGNIPLNPPAPPGLVYRVQMAIFRNPVALSYFKGLSPVERFRSEGSDLSVYYVGLFRKAADASQALLKVRAMGFRDAFVVAFMDNKQISTERASVLEKEWGSRPLFEEEEKIAAEDAIPPTLVFRVELMRTQKPVPKEKMEEIKRLASERGLDILTDDKKLNIYLIGTFLSYRSAAEYADLLIRNGYREARVSAYLGQKEIPVDIARKLFEEY